MSEAIIIKRAIIIIVRVKKTHVTVYLDNIYRDEVRLYILIFQKKVVVGFATKKSKKKAGAGRDRRLHMPLNVIK